MEKVEELRELIAFFSQRLVDQTRAKRRLWSWTHCCQVARNKTNLMAMLLSVLAEQLYKLIKCQVCISENHSAP